MGIMSLKTGENLGWYEGFGAGIDIRRVAHTPTAALNTTCLQFQPAPARPISAALTLGHAGLAVPAAVAAARARSAGKYRLSPVHER